MQFLLMEFGTETKTLGKPSGLGCPLALPGSGGGPRAEQGAEGTGDPLHGLGRNVGTKLGGQSLR